jgi:DNA (cytosine-5)-methyltransferase 1
MNGPFTFTDLFAGIGGMRIPFEELGGHCVFSSEWNKFSQRTYEANFGEIPVGDIRKVDEQIIPDHDILLAGFPCQPFSIAGVSKKNSLGREHGFLDKTQGTLFFDIARILEAKRPKAFLLENVRNLVSHDHGRTFETILKTLEDLEYGVSFRIIDAAHWVPQHRERIYMVGFDMHRFGSQARFDFPELPQNQDPELWTVLESNPDPKYTLTEHLWKYLQAYKEVQKTRGNGFGFGMADPHEHTRTLSARYYKDGSEILVRTGGQTPRRLTPRECLRLMGFPDSFKIVVSDMEAYRQFGNAVVVPVVRFIAPAMLNTLRSLEKGSDVFTKDKRSEVMSHIGSKNTRIELQVRHWLRSEHIGYRLHAKALPGTPDVVLSKYKMVVFVNGCFFHQHGCRLSPMPKQNSDFWRSKFDANRQRDKRNHEALAALGWQVVIIWECDLEDHPERVFQDLKSALAEQSRRRHSAHGPSLPASPSTECPVPDSVMPSTPTSEC